jgi:hypothetical protein
MPEAGAALRRDIGNESRELRRWGACSRLSKTDRAIVTASVEWRLVAFACRSARNESRPARRRAMQLAFQAAFGLHVAMRRPRREFWFYFNTAPEDADEVCREISAEIELLGFQPLIRFA